MSQEEWAYGILNQCMGKTMAREQNDAELTQLRAEVAMLRAQQERYEVYQKETEAQKKSYAAFLAWVSLTAEQRTQLEADKKFAGDPGDTWEVQLQEHPKVKLPATSEFDAIGKYNLICGITGTAHKHSASKVAA